MLGTGNHYKVAYVANDGAKLAFTFQSDRSFRTYRNNDAFDGVALGRPFMNDLFEAAQSYNHEGTKMYEHGGFTYTRIQWIECIETKHRQYFLG